jgi:hemolysin III
MGWYVFTAVWTVAALGIIKKIFWIHAPRWISTAFYLLMGWAGVLLFPAIYRNLDFGAIVWVAAGGLLYTVGAIIYGLQRPNPIPEKFGFHEIWHLFVLGASFCHYWMVYYYITPIT